MVFSEILTTFLTPQSEVYIQLARFTIVLVLGIVLTRFIFVPLVKRLTAKKSDKKAQQQVNNIFTILGMFITFTAALQAGEFGNLLTVIGAVAAALTVAVGFGMREEVGNIVSGILIHIDNPFVKGDYIKLEDEEGQVREINLRSTVLNGHASEEIMVPNGKIGANVLKNFTRGVKTKSSIEFKVSPKRTDEIANLIEEIAKEDEEVLESPEPNVLYRKFEDSKNVFEIRYWVRDSGDSKRIKSRLLEKFNQQALEKGILDEEETSPDKENPSKTEN